MPAADPSSPTDPATTGSGPRFEREKPRRRWLRWLAIPLVLLLVLVFVAGTFLKPYKVPSPSMTPTIQPGDRILAGRDAGEPEVEQVVVIRPPADADDLESACAGGVPDEGTACEVPSKVARGKQSFVQRIVGGPGDRIELRDGRLLRNGRPTDDAGFAACTDVVCTFAPITVPRGHWFTLGDNRGNAVDGRFFGPVPTAAIVGPVRARYWPPDRLGGL